MTRLFILARAQKTYKPENYPISGINQINTSNVKRSIHKTGTKIYTLIGTNVWVSDYNGRIIRIETLDPSIHKKFFE